MTSILFFALAATILHNTIQKCNTFVLFYLEKKRAIYGIC